MTGVVKQWSDSINQIEQWGHKDERPHSENLPQLHRRFTKNQTSGKVLRLQCEMNVLNLSSIEFISIVVRR